MFICGNYNTHNWLGQYKLLLTFVRPWDVRDMPQDEFVGKWPVSRFKLENEGVVCKIIQIDLTAFSLHFSIVISTRYANT